MTALHTVRKAAGLCALLWDVWGHSRTRTSDPYVFLIMLPPGSHEIRLFVTREPIGYSPLNPSEDRIISGYWLRLNAEAETLTGVYLYSDSLPVGGLSPSPTPEEKKRQEPIIRRRMQRLADVLRKERPEHSVIFLPVQL